MTRTCKNCEWWVGIGLSKDGKPERGKCHGAPPLILGNENTGYFPTTWPDDWCGEFEQKDEERVGR